MAGDGMAGGGAWGEPGRRRARSWPVATAAPAPAPSRAAGRRQPGPYRMVTTRVRVKDSSSSRPSSSPVPEFFHPPNGTPP